MIYTLTMNPSLDYFADVNEFQMGRTNRTVQEVLRPGGKGLNVSILLGRLGMETTALGFAAGFTGEELIKRMESTGVCCDFIRAAEGMTRINVKLRQQDGTEINGMGPNLSLEELSALEQKLNCMRAGDTLVLSGSLPKNVPTDFYAVRAKELGAKGIRVVVDAAGEVLRTVLPCKPFLIKPNRQELEELFGAEALEKEEGVRRCVLKLRQEGARNVLFSRGGEEVLLAAQDGRMYRMQPPKGQIVNSIAAGDSMVAGFLYGYDTGHTIAEALRYAVAAGSATAFHPWLAEKEDIEKVKNELGEMKDE